ncbi:hypothetical protein [Amycolatopsis kentuckyensis]|uniref:hypothetical protein n=1 Tax=Amycolatopsis kentuckyensis TaxID=218823 RepID=UPI003567AC72
MSRAFPYKINQAVSGMLPGGNGGVTLANGTVTRIGASDAHGYRKVHVSFGFGGDERDYSVSRSGACDYLSPTPLRPTVNDDRVTPNTAYTVEPDAGRFVAKFEGEPIVTCDTEAAGWDAALRHDGEAREAARRAKLDPTAVVTGCLWHEHLSGAWRAAERGRDALEEFARKTLTDPPHHAGYVTQSAARDLRALGFDGVDWAKVYERFEHKSV